MHSRDQPRFDFTLSCLPSQDTISWTRVDLARGEKPFRQQPWPRLLLAADNRQPLGTQLDAAPTVRLLLAAQSGQLEKPGVIQVSARSFFGRSLGLTRNRSSRNPACFQSNRRRETWRASSRGRETVSAASVGLENARARCPGRLPLGAAGPWALLHDAPGGCPRVPPRCTSVFPARGL